MPYYSKWGMKFFEVILRNSYALEQQFLVLAETN
jgi:hypothetical protein